MVEIVQFEPAGFVESDGGSIDAGTGSSLHPVAHQLLVETLAGDPETASRRDATLTMALQGAPQNPGLEAGHLSRRHEVERRGCPLAAREFRRKYLKSLE